MSERKDVIWNLRLSAEQKERWLEASRGAQISLSEYVRAAVDAAAAMHSAAERAALLQAAEEALGEDSV